MLKFLNYRYFYIVLIFILATITLSIIFRDDFLITGRPLTEDGYYSFTVARNIALGNGFTVGQGIRTNGFQPLFTIILSIPYLLTSGDKIVTLRIILFIEWIIYVLTAIVIGKIGKNFIKRVKINEEFNYNISLLISYIYLSCVSIFLLHFNGLETGLLLLFYSLLWYLYQNNFTKDYKNLFFYSILLGILVLIRIDTVFFVILFSLSQIIINSYLFKERIVRFFIVSITSFIVTLPWWLYNYIYFGSFIPTSGVAQQSWSFDLLRVREALIALSQNLMPLVYLGTATLEGWVSNVVRIFLIILFGLLTIKIWNKTKKQIIKDECCKRNIIFGSIIILSMLILIFYYTFSFYATWFYFRYFAPIILLSILLIGIVISYLISKIPKLNILMVLLILPLTVSVYLIWKGYYPNEYYIHQLALVKDFVQNNEYVGAFQSGTLGYFYDNTINLDGKTNIEAIKHRNNLLEYLENKNIGWLCDWKWKLEKLLVGEKPESRKLWVKISEKGKFLLLKKDINKLDF